MEYVNLLMEIILTFIWKEAIWQVPIVKISEEWGEFQVSSEDSMYPKNNSYLVLSFAAANNASSLILTP